MRVCVRGIIGVLWLWLPIGTGRGPSSRAGFRRWGYSPAGSNTLAPHAILFEAYTWLEILPYLLISYFTLTICKSRICRSTLSIGSSL